LKKSCSLPLMQSVVGRTLTSFANEVVLREASVVSEGTVTTGERDGEKYFSGSTMVTIRFTDLDLDPFDGNGGREALIEALKKSISFHIRLLRLARREAEQRCTPYLPVQMSTELEFTIEGDALLVDIDIECPLSEPRDDVGLAPGDSP
jgi:hypothetical protein